MSVYNPNAVGWGKVHAKTQVEVNFGTGVELVHSKG